MECAGEKWREYENEKVRNNRWSEVVVHSIDESRLMDDDDKVGGKLQRGREKFQRDGEGSLIGLLCSRNTRSRTPLVGRAQWETDPSRPSVDTLPGKK
jgi:hypothetical protein